MKKLINRFLCFIFIISLLLLNSSCGFIVWNDGSEPDDTQAGTTAPDTDPPSTDTPGTNVPNVDPPPVIPEAVSPREAARERLSALPSTDLGYRTIIIATTNPEVVCPSIDTDNEIIRIRSDIHRAVEEKFGASIIQYAADANTLLTEAKNAYNTDMYYADLFSIPQNKLGVFQAEGILANMNSLPFANYSADYYNQNINANARLGSIQFGISGTANLEFDKINCVYFNKTLLEACTGENIYSIVNDGKWTYDLLNELALTEVQDTEFIPLGATLPTLDFIDTYASAQNIEFISGLPTAPTIQYFETGEAEKVENIVTSLYNMIYKDKTLAKTAGSDTKELFISGDLMFCFDNLTFIEELPLTGIEWGLLPMPKYSEEQEDYISPTSPDMQIFCALANTPSYETSGIILEALNLAAHDYIDKTFKDTCIDYHMRDSGSVSMMNKIFDSASCDFAHMFGPGANYVPEATYLALQRAVTTRSTVNYYYRNYGTAANRALVAALAKYE